MAKTLILSVGGSTEPLIHSIQHHKPDFVCFVVSEGSVDQMADIKDKLGEMCSSITFRHFTTDDPENLASSYKAARQAYEWAKKKIDRPDELTVDYTGGTKVMSAALVLATVECGCKFSYVAGKERSKDGLGVVITGSEQVREEATPWEALAIEQRRAFTLFFNQYQFSAAIEIGRFLLERAPKGEQPIFKNLVELAEGYYFWDIFDHREALPKIKRAFDGLKNYYTYGVKKELPEFLKQIGENIAFLTRLTGKREGGKDVALIQDIFNNAQRRIEEGKYDDATMRLYRTLEKIMQVEFKKEFGCETGSVEPACLPESIRDEYIDKYQSKGKSLKLALDATAKALKENNNKVGKYYFENFEKRIRNLLQMRNNSILAHGDVSVTKDHAEQFKAMVTEFLKTFKLFKEIRFPKIKL